MSETQKKTGLFLCKCGANIAQNVDLDELEKWGQKRPGVNFVATHNLLCSAAGKKFFLETLEKNNVDAVVIAACSPKMHEHTFRDLGVQRKVNLAQVSMANIREQAAWVTPDKREATEKSRVLIEAALQRSATHENLEARSMDGRTEIVIIGGGIAGIEAALTAAEAGRSVTIIEKEISLGGSVIKTEELAPSMECAPCILAPRLTAIRNHKNITVITNAEVTDVLGFFGNFTVRVKRKARYVTSACIGCEACFEQCPVSVTSSFHLGMGTRKAIYTAFPGSVPAAAAIDGQSCLRLKGETCTACVTACDFNAIDFNDQDELLEFAAGAIIMATGASSVACHSLAQFGAGNFDNVFTMEQFERLAASNGPTGGEIKCVNGSTPTSLAVIHCAGSLCTGGLSYCSGICCTTALKAGELFRKKALAIGSVVNIHDRLVFTSAAAEHFYSHQKQEGTQFIRTSDLTALMVTKSGSRLTISGKDFTPCEVDMIVLSTGMAPGNDTQHFSDLIGLELDSLGFFKPDNPLINAIGASMPGIYAAGACASPCDVPTAVTRSRAAAGDALSKLVEGRKIPLEVMTSYINGEVCSGCKLCISVCPYRAISYDAAHKKSVVNEGICRGCGTCAAACPSSAATARHFTNSQMYAEIKGVLHG